MISLDLMKSSELRKVGDQSKNLLFLYYRFYISMDLSDEKYTKCKLEECINVDFFIKVLEFCTRVDLRGSGVFCRVLPGFNRFAKKE